jgi:hypothetical protein
MKTYMVCGTLCVVGFLAMGMQLGLFRPGAANAIADDADEGSEAKKPVARAKFPIDLAPAAKAQPVPPAASFTPSDKPHKIAILKTTGSLHEWQDSIAGYHVDWAAERVEETELVLVVGGHRKIQVSHHTYPNGAPPITRYQYHLEASLIEAKTGHVIAHRLFQNRPRQIRPVEAWELTAIGQPVSYQTVFRWASHIAKFGPPEQPDPTPIVTEVGD